MLDLRAVNRNRFDLAKRLWAWSIATKVVVFVLGSTSVFVEGVTVYTPQIMLILVIIAELLAWRSGVIKSRSEALLRNLDLCQSFGRRISKADKRDIVSYLPKKVRDQFESSSVVDDYFASKTSPGPRKAVENLVESAWYTKRLSAVMTGLSMALIVILLMVSVLALIASSHEIESTATRADVSKVVASWILLIFTLGISRNAWGYYRLFRRSVRTEMSASHLLSGSVAESDAIKQWYEYQVVRAAAPLIPNWLWQIMKDSLSDAWERASAT